MGIFKKKNKENVPQQETDKDSKGKKEKVLKQKKVKTDRKNKKFKPSQDALVSLDFGSGDIKGVYGRIQGNKIRVNKLFSVPVVGNWYRNGSIENLPEGMRALDRLFSENKITNKNVACTIESTNIVKREIIVPAISKEDMDSMLQYEMEQYLPIDTAEYVMQYVERDRFVEDGVEKLKLLVVMVPKSIVQGLQQFFQDANLIPYALDVHFNSMCKLIELNSGKINDDYVMDSTIAIINIGNTTTDILVIKEGQYQFNVILDFGYSVLRDVVSAELGISGQELMHKTDELLLRMFKEFDTEAEVAREIKEDVYDNINQYLIGTLSDKTETFVADIERSLKYYTMQGQDRSIEKIYIYGGGTSRFNLAEVMERELKIKTEPLQFMECVELPENVDLSPYWNAIGGLIRI